MLRQVLIAALTFAFAPLAAADEAWTTLTLAGGVTIDVPSVAAKQALPATPYDGTLMLFSINEGDKFLTCHLTWQAYRKDMTRAQLLAFLRGKNHGRLCLSRHTGEADVMLETSVTRTHNGSPAGSCLASYTADAEPKSRAETLFTIADEMAFYSLACNVASHDDAMIDWLETWKGRIDHMEQSLRVK